MKRKFYSLTSIRRRDFSYNTRKISRFNRTTPKKPRLLITNGISPPKLNPANKIAAGDWAEVYLEGNKITRAIYPADSNQKMLKKLTKSSYLQNYARDRAKVAPRVYSVGMRTDGRIYQTMEYLQGYTPLHATNVDKRQVDLVARKLARHNIAHNDINTGNIMVSPRGRIKIIDFDTATIKPGGSQGDRNLLTRIGNLYHRK